MQCQKSGQPVELCKECQEQKAEALRKAGVNQVTPYRDEVRGDVIPGNASSDG